MRRFAILLALLSIWLASPASARSYDTVLANPDSRTSITLAAGYGESEGHRDGDLETFSLALTHPVTRDLSFLARWEHVEFDAVRAYLGSESRVFTVGLKFYLP